MIKQLLTFLATFLMPSFSGGGGGGGDSTQTVVNSPWGPAEGYIKDIMKEGQRLYNETGPDYFPNATYVPFSPQSQTAMTLAQNRALMGSPLIEQGKDLTMSTLQGDYLNSNPYLDQMYDNAASAVTRKFREATAPSIDAQANKAGRYGSDLYLNRQNQAQEELGRNLNRLAGDVYGQNYQQERARQQQLLPFSQQLANQDYSEIGQLAQIGQAVEGKAGEMLNDRINRFNYYQNLPMEKLRSYNQLITSASGGTGSQSATAAQQGNTASNVVGGALAGSQLVPYAAEALAPAGMTVGSWASPWLMGGGALAGGLLGGLLG